MGGTDADKVVEKFRKIMGPVALTLAKDTAKEVGANILGESIVTKDAGQLDRFRNEYGKKCGKIIGEKLAETMLREK